MFRDLPEFVQKQILTYLAADNFSGAKALHDAWLRHQALNPAAARAQAQNSQDLLPEQKVKLIEHMLSISDHKK